MEVLQCTGSTHKCLEFFYEHIEKLKPVENFTAFFDNANFLLTNYKIEYPGTHAIIAGNGKEMHLTSINCGYGGASPSGTEEIIVHLGVPPKKAELLKWERGLSIDFSNNIYSVNKPKLFFANSTTHKHLDELTFCVLGDNTCVELENNKREVHMLNPTRNNLKNFYNCLDEMKPTTVTYIPDYSITHPDGLVTSILEITGAKFNLYCKGEYEEIYRLFEDVYKLIYKEKFKYEIKNIKEWFEQPQILYRENHSFTIPPTEDMTNTMEL